MFTKIFSGSSSFIPCARTWLRW